MPGRSVKAEEVAAGEIVVGQLGEGEATPHDVLGAPDESHDVDIQLPGGRSIALEVTSAADAAMRSMRAAAFEKIWCAPSLRADWWISFDGGSPVQIKGMMRGLEAHLKVLEDHEVTEVGRFTPPRPDAPRAVVEATSQILAGRITTALSSAAPPPGESARMLLTPHRGLSAGGGEVNARVVEAAEANVEKLLAAGADKRHLFIWVDEDAAELEMFSQPPPSSTPSLPDGIDVVWTATRAKAAGALFERLWRLQPPGGWEAITA